MKFGVLTGGGDCPGLNPAIRAVVRRAAKFGHETVGFLDGWKGVRDDTSRTLTVPDVAELLGKGGTVLGSSRTNPFAKEADASRVLETLARHRVDALIAIGGDDTLSAARELHRRGGHVVGVPKTMDNDVAGTDWTFGFHSATAVAVDALERLRDTAGSHHRAIVLEVMGRHAGWVALATGLAGGADVTLVPEEKFDEAALLAHVRAAVQARGTRSSWRARGSTSVRAGARPERRTSSGTSCFGSERSGRSSRGGSRKGQAWRPEAPRSGTFSAAAPPCSSTGSSRRASEPTRSTSRSPVDSARSPSCGART